MSESNKRKKMKKDPDQDQDPSCPWMYSYSNIDDVIDEIYIETLVSNIMKDSGAAVFLTKAKHLLKLLRSGPLDSDAEADMISSAACHLLIDPCFLRAVPSTMKEDIVLGLAIYSNSNSLSTFDRMVRMRKDWRFANLMSSLSDSTATAPTISACLSILIAHWIDRDKLSDLGKRMGVTYFDWKMKCAALRKSKAEALKGRKLPEPEVHEFSFTIESASEDPNMVHFRNELVDKYGQERLNIDALLNEVKRELETVLSISQNHLGYDGKKATIEVFIVNGKFGFMTLKSSRRL